MLLTLDAELRHLALDDAERGTQANAALSHEKPSRREKDLACRRRRCRLRP